MIPKADNQYPMKKQRNYAERCANGMNSMQPNNYGCMFVLFTKYQCKE